MLLSILQIVFVIAASLVLGVGIYGQNTKTRIVQANLSKVIGNPLQTRLRVVSVGEVAEGLCADWKEQLTILKHGIGFYYLQMYGLLNDEIAVYGKDKQGTLQYALLKMHIRPFVESTFMSSKLASGKSTIFCWNGNASFVDKRQFPFQNFFEGVSA